MVDEIDPKMPAPWFRAKVFSSTIRSIAANEVWRVADEARGERQLGPFVLPHFQRPPAWKNEQQVNLLRSVWDGLPIGSIVYNATIKDSQCDGWLLDGQQRITAILAYLDGQFPVYGYKFMDLPRPERLEFMNRSIAALETNLDDPAKCEDIYRRLAYGGTPHES